jgi:hypothetical protein
VESVHYTKNSKGRFFYACGACLSTVGFSRKNRNILNLGTSFSTCKILVTTINHLRDPNERIIVK